MKYGLQMLPQHSTYFALVMNTKQPELPFGGWAAKMQGCGIFTAGI